MEDTGPFVMIDRPMSSPVFRKFLFTITFPRRDVRREHISRLKMHSLAKNQLSDMEVIETIDHLFRCQRCFENYRHVRNAFEGNVRAKASR